MNVDSSSLIFIWLLPLTSCSAMTTGQTPSLLTTTQEAPALASAPPQAAATTNLTLPPQTSTPSVQTEAPPQRNHSQPAENSTAEAAGGSVPPSTPATAHASTETSPTPSTDATTAATATSASRSTDIAAIPTSPPTGTTVLALTTTPPTQSTNKPGVLPSPTTTPKHATEPQKKKTTLDKEVSYESTHGVVVGWVVGGALVLMMLSFLLIYIRKHKLSERQITTKNWAGPSPFIENGRDDGQDGPRSSNRISLSSFLPQRMSRRLSLLPETEEEMEDITPGSTFGDRHQEASSAQQGAGQGDPGRKGPDVKEEPVQAASPQADTPASPGPEAASLTDPPPPNGVGESAQG